MVKFVVKIRQVKTFTTSIEAKDRVMASIIAVKQLRGIERDPDEVKEFVHCYTIEESPENLHAQLSSKNTKNN
jgi:hypothetical protein